MTRTVGTVIANRINAGIIVQAISRYISECLTEGCRGLPVRVENTRTARNKAPTTTISTMISSTVTSTNRSYRLLVRSDVGASVSSGYPACGLHADMASANSARRALASTDFREGAVINPTPSAAEAPERPAQTRRPPHASDQELHKEGKCRESPP